MEETGFVIETSQLTRTFDGLVAVDSITLSVPKGTIYGLLGRNGAGKTTTLKMLSTVLRPTRGTARIAGHDVVQEPMQVRRAIGAVGEGVETTRPFWTPRDYLRFFLGLHRVASREAIQIADEWLRRLDLWDHRNRLVGGFSSGMRKRLELCRALSRQPQVLLLDEPTKELDIPGKREMWDLVKTLVAEEEVTVFLCSHDAEEIRVLCEQIGIIRGGNLQHSGPVESFGGSVFKILDAPEDAPILLGQRFDVLSHARIGSALYVALKGEVGRDAVEEHLNAKNAPYQGLAEAREFSERVSAFL